jgi:hypothetical protein
MASAREGADVVRIAIPLLTRSRQLACDRREVAVSELERDVEIIGESWHAVQRDGLRSEHVPPDSVSACDRGERGDGVVEGRSGAFAERSSRGRARSGGAFRSLLQAHSPLATSAPIGERATARHPFLPGSLRSRRLCAGALPHHRALRAGPIACPPSRRRTLDQRASRAQDTAAGPGQERPRLSTMTGELRKSIAGGEPNLVSTNARHSPL